MKQVLKQEALVTALKRATSAWHVPTMRFVRIYLDCEH